MTRSVPAAPAAGGSTGVRGSGPVLSVPQISIDARGDGDGVAFGLSRSGLALLLVVVGVVLVVSVGAIAAGTYFLVTSGNDVDLDLVPEGSDTVSYVNVDQATSDQAIREVVDAYLELRAQSEFYSGPATMEQSLARFERETGLDPDALHHATSFSKYDEATGEGAGEYSATIVRSDWSEADVVRAVEQDSSVTLQETEYSGVTVYSPEGAPAGSSAWLAALGDGTYVFGTEQAVRDTIAVQQGDLEAFSGDLRSAFEGTDSGYIRFAARVPQEQIPDQTVGQSVDAGQYRAVEIVSGRYYTSGNTLGVQTTLHTASESDAMDVMDVTDGGISLLTGLAENETVQSTLRDVEVTREGTDVTVTYENSVEGIKLLLYALDEGGRGGGGTGSGGDGGGDGKGSLQDATSSGADLAADGADATGRLVDRQFQR